MLDVLALGEILADFFALDAAGRPVAAEHGVRFVGLLGGAPANFTAGLARRGIQVALMSQVGDDQTGRFLLGALAGEGVDVSRVRTTRRAKTGLSFVSIDMRGDRSFDFYGAPSADVSIDEDTVRPWLPFSARLFHFGTNVLVLDAGRRAAALALSAAREARAIVSCDLNLRPEQWADERSMREQARVAVRHCDWLKVSDEELEPVTGERDPDRAAAALLALGPTLVVATLGAAGARAYTARGVRLVVPSLAERVLDTTGAGDAFWSGFVASLLARPALDAETVGRVLDAKVLARALDAGSENAASVVASVGAVPGLLTVPASAR